MKKTFVKICGITNREDAEIAVISGADALGFVFYPKSPRFITTEDARKICEYIPGNILKIGVFVDAESVELAALRTENFLNYFQLHGDESPDFCRRFPGKIIKAFRINNNFNKDVLKDYSTCSMFLFDTKVEGLYGGSGIAFDWNILRSIPRSRPVILAGGLNEDNAAEAIRLVKPYMVDVSSSVESHPGKKDAAKIARFIKSCKLESSR